MGESWTQATERLQRDGVVLQELDAIDEGSLKGCDAVVIMGPRSNVQPDEVLALEEFRRAGGSLLVALRSRTEPGQSLAPDAGLGLVLEAGAIRVGEHLVVDPEGALDLPGTWMTYEGYGEHPIVGDFLRRRATVWQSPRALVPAGPGASVLVRASDAASGEAVAMAAQNSAGGRLVVVGSAEVFSDYWSDRGIGGNERLLAGAMYWVLHRDAALPGASAVGKRLERVRLLMSQRQLKAAFVWCVVAGPAFLALLGAFLWWWRRREP